MKAKLISKLVHLLDKITNGGPLLGSENNSVD